MSVDRSGTVDLLMVRHGESEWNALGRWQGHADPPLSARGVEQAREVALALGGFDAVISSDLQRAHHTAELLAEAIGIGPVITDRRLRETYAGEWQGLTHAEIDLHWPGYLEAGKRPPQFEQPEHAAQRAVEALHELVGHLTGTVVLAVSHSGTIRALRQRCGAPGPRLPNLAGVWFHLAEGTLRAGSEVHLLGEETLAVTD